MKENMEKNATVWDKLQKEFKCCGINSPADWNRDPLPDSCCFTPTAGCSLNGTDHYKGGCLQDLTDWVEKHVYYVGAVGIAFAFIQVDF